MKSKRYFQLLRPQISLITVHLDLSSSSLMDNTQFYNQFYLNIKEMKLLSSIHPIH